MAVIPIYSYTDWHPTLMCVTWNLTINVAIFFAIFKNNRINFYVHAFMGFIIWVVLLGFCIPYFKDFLFEVPDLDTTAHNKIGLTIMVIGSVVALLGFLGRVFQVYTEFSSLLIYILKKSHVVLAYLCTILSKANVLSVMYCHNIVIFLLLFSFECFSIYFLIMHKIYYPSLQQTIVPPRDYHQDMKTQSIQSLKQIPEEFTDFVIFANRVYDIGPLKTEHPAGVQIVNSVKGRQVDRFIYGMYKSESLPSVPTNSHSYRSFDLLGAPIAKLDIQSQYGKLSNESKIFIIDEIKTISKQEQIYKISLKPKYEKFFPYEGYKIVHQLGRYYTLTLNHSVTRLYTMVNFLHRKNLKLMKTALPYGFQEQIDNSGATSAIVLGSNSGEQIINDSQEDNCLPLLIKKYDTGKLTPTLIKNDNLQSIELSSPQGQGLHFSSLKLGKIIVVAGGTGHYPFCDLIDLLFKSVLISQKHQLSNKILKNDPVLAFNPFEKFSFLFMISLNHLVDMHPVTLRQLTFLSEHNQKFKLFFKIKENTPQLASNNPKIEFMKTHFQKLLADEMVKEDYSHIYICGPPPMNESLLSMLNEKGTTKFTML